MNQGNKQVQELTKEELQKTQVLNLKELEETIVFEKKTSKKPAIFVAILGIFSIIAGTSIMTVQHLNNVKIEQQKNEIQKKVVKPPQVLTTKLECNFTTSNNPDGTDTDFTINYQFENNKLVSFTKTFIMTQTAGNEAGLATIESYKTAYQSFLNPTLGYQITLTPKDANGLIVTVQVDYKKLNPETVNPTQGTHFSTSLDYQKDTDLKKIQTEMSMKGYNCK